MDRLTGIAKLRDGLLRVVHIPNLDHVVSRAPVTSARGQHEPLLWSLRRELTWQRSGHAREPSFGSFLLDELEPS